MHHKPLPLALAVVVILLLIGGGYRVASLRGVALPGLPAVSIQKIQKENPTAQYTIDVAYPQVVHLSDADIQKKINEAVQTRAMSEINEFVKGANQERNLPFGEATSTLQVVATVEDFNPRYFSVRQLHTEFNAGAAHPLETVTGLNYDLETGKEIVLGDVFRSESESLQFLSDYVRNDLEGQFGSLGGKTAELKQWFTDGTAPTQENFSTFLLRRDTLVVVFNTYQVAPYIFGRHEVAIPWTAMRALVADAWQPPMP